MRRTASVLLVAMAAMLGLWTVPAQAQLARTFVSVNGSDANDCDRLTPCRTFQGAHDKTLPNGEIVVLDPGDFRPVSIAKSISITNEGVGEAGMEIVGTDRGIEINADAGAKISLRGLTIRGGGPGVAGGIMFFSGASLTIENCIIRNIDVGAAGGGNGIIFIPFRTATLAVSNTFIANNKGAAIQISPVGAGTFHAALNRVELHNNSTGVTVSSSDSPLDVVIVDSVVANNGRSGRVGAFDILAHKGQVNVILRRTFVVNNNVGIIAAGPRTNVGVAESTVTGNARTWLVEMDAVLRSYGDNYIASNFDGDPPLSPIPVK